MIDYIQIQSPALQPDNNPLMLMPEDFEVLLPILEMLAQRGRRMRRSLEQASLGDTSSSFSTPSATEVTFTEIQT